MSILQLILVCASVQQAVSSGAGRHSLWVFATYGPAQRFSAVMMLDDIQVGYYEPHMTQLLSSSRGTPLDVDHRAVAAFEDIYHGMKNELAQVIHLLNMTEGNHICQRIVGCEIQDGEPASMMLRDSVDAQDTEGLSYNTTHFSNKVRGDLEARWGKPQWTLLQTVYQEFYFPVCVNVLKQLLEQNRNLVTRRVRPRFRIFSTQAKGQTLVTCLATDFYPRQINLTMLQDGRQVEEHLLTSTPALPNGNGLYQMRKTLVLTPELLGKHTYNCTANHVSVDNSLSVTWRAESYHSRRAHFISPIVLATAFLLLILVLVLVMCRLRHKPEGPRDLPLEEQASFMTRGTESGS